MQKTKLSWFLKLMLLLSLAFLYIPLVVLVIYSFNESKLVTVWGGFSTKWYGALMENDTILEAAWLSLRIAIVSSLAAVALGTLAGYAMARIKRFRGSTLFAGMISAPMVMPDVITGLSMLLLIIQVQMFLQGSELLQSLYFDRGFFTIFLGHTTLCMAVHYRRYPLALGGIGSILGRSCYGLGCPSAEDFLRDYPTTDCPCDCFRLPLGHYPVFGRLGDYLLPVRPGFIDIAASDFLQNQTRP